MAKMKAALVLGSVALLGVGTYAAFSADEDVAKTRHLTNQVWIERMPEDHRDMVGHIVLLDREGEQWGAIGRSSAWRHAIEVFGWRLENDRLGLFFPQDRVRAKAKARTWRCEGEAPEPFEICLEISANGRSIQFYSRRDWVVKDAESLEDLAVEVPELASVFENTSVSPATVDLNDAEFTDGLIPLR